MKFCFLWSVFRQRACIVGKSGICTVDLGNTINDHFFIVWLFLKTWLGLMVKVKEISREVNFWYYRCSCDILNDRVCHENSTLRYISCYYGNEHNATPFDSETIEDFNL